MIHLLCPSTLILSFDLNSLSSELQETLSLNEVTFHAREVLHSRASIPLLVNSNDSTLQLDQRAIFSIFKQASACKGDDMLSFSNNSLRTNAEYPYDCMKVICDIFNNRQRHCLVTITYSIRGRPNMSNNFACSVFIALNESTLTMMYPWSGPYWESIKLDPETGQFWFKSYVIGSAVEYNLCNQTQNWAVLMTDNVSRSIMRDFEMAMIPFKTSGRRCSNGTECENVLSWHPQTYTRFVPFYVQISDVHRCFKTKLPLNAFVLVVNLLVHMHAFDLLLPCANEDSRLTLFRIDFFWACVVKALNCISGKYRPDYYGEDLGHAFDALKQSEVTAALPLLAGGDCEDFAKTLLQFDHTRLRVSSREPMLPEIKPIQDEILRMKAMIPPNIFFIARVSCKAQQNKEDNHTCGALLHTLDSNTGSCSIHIVESTFSQVVVPVKQEGLAEIKSRCQRTHFITPSECRGRYRNVYILGSHLVFEFGARALMADSARTEDKAGMPCLHLGAEPFLQYDRVFQINGNKDTAQVLRKFLVSCDQLRSGANPNPHSRILLLIEESAFYQHYDTFKALAEGAEDMPDTRNIIPMLADYTAFSRDLCGGNLRAIFAEDTKENNARAFDYSQKHDVSSFDIDLNVQNILLSVFHSEKNRGERLFIASGRDKMQKTISQNDKKRMLKLVADISLVESRLTRLMTTSMQKRAISMHNRMICRHCYCLQACAEDRDCILRNISKMSEEIRTQTRYPLDFQNLIHPLLDQLDKSINLADERKDFDSASLVLRCIETVHANIDAIAKS